jgi:urea transporter
VAEDERAGWSTTLDGFLRSYGEVLFSSSRIVGAVFVLATWMAPKTALFGALAVGVGLLTTRLMNFSDEASRQGLFGYNVALVGLAIGAGFPATLSVMVLLVGAAITTVFVTAAMRSFFAIFGLPPLSLPFLVVVLAVLAAAPALGLHADYAAFQLGQSYWSVPTVVTDFLVTLGSILFVPSPAAGLLVLAGLVYASRISAVYAVVGYLFAVGLGVFDLAAIPASSQLFLTITTVVIGVALGGVWFVPSLSSLALVAFGSVVGAVFAIANYSLFQGVGYPILFLPLNLTIWLVLFAMRQRMQDTRPKSVELIGGTPEANLAYYRNRVARFGAHYFIRFRAPFMGRWVCTQSTEGRITHRGYWKHALDFEVLGPSGGLFEGSGTRARDYYCYGLPVLAPADGTVVRVVGDVADNPIGEMNLSQNWGNHVLLHHGGGIYSLCAHLMPEKTTVWEGQTVRRGDEIGRCGNSGRSPTPHLHFHLQSSPVVGAPTIVTELHDVFMEDEVGERLANTAVPAEGEEVRNIQPLPELPMVLGAEAETTFRVDDTFDEQVELNVDLLNRRTLRSALGATLFYDFDDLVFTIHEVVGARQSVLYLLRMALGRLPNEVGHELSWTDHLPRHYARGWLTRWLFDFVAPFLPDGGIAMTYRGRRDGSGWVVEGRATDGHDLTTTARLDDRGVASVKVTLRDRTRHAERIDSSTPARANSDESNS